MSFILTATGFLLLALALLGVGLGIYMAVEPKTRASGKLFAIWWVPGLAAASGQIDFARGPGDRWLDSEKTTKENRLRDSGRAAS